MAVDGVWVLVLWVVDRGSGVVDRWGWDRVGIMCYVRRCVDDGIGILGYGCLILEATMN